MSALPAPSVSSTRRIIIVIVVVLALVLVAGGIVAAVLLTRPAGDVAEGTVGPDGFSLSVRDVVVTAPAGVAPEGTSVRVAVDDNIALPAGFAAIATPIGAAIIIELDGGAVQPAVPISIEVRIGSDSEQSTADTVPLMVAEDPDAPLGARFAYSDWDDRDRTLVATAEHLSWLIPVKVSGASFAEQVSEWFSQALQISTPEPSCSGRSASTGDISVSMPRPTDQVAWPCVSVTGGDVLVSLQSSSGLVWEVASDPAGTPRAITAFSVAGVITAALAGLDDAVGDTRTVMLPRETARVVHDPEDLPASIRLTVAPVLSQVSILVMGIMMYLPEEWVKPLELGECIVDVLKAPGAESSEVAGAVTRCFAVTAGSVVSGLLAPLLAAPAMLASQFEGIARTIAGADEVRLSIRVIDRGPVTLPPNPTGSTYLLLDGEADWSAAVARCVAEGGALATIDSAEENAYVYAWLTSQGGQTAYFGYHRADNGAWAWAGAPSSTGYENWASGEPNDERGLESYAQFYWKYTDGTWNDGDFQRGTVEDPGAFICELAAAS